MVVTRSAKRRSLGPAAAVPDQVHSTSSSSNLNMLPTPASTASSAFASGVSDVDSPTPMSTAPSVTGENSPTPNGQVTLGQSRSLTRKRTRQEPCVSKSGQVVRQRCSSTPRKSGIKQPLLDIVIEPNDRVSANSISAPDNTNIRCPPVALSPPDSVAAAESSSVSPGDTETPVRRSQRIRKKPNVTSTPTFATSSKSKGKAPMVMDTETDSEDGNYSDEAVIVITDESDGGENQEGEDGESNSHASSPPVDEPLVVVTVRRGARVKRTQRSLEDYHPELVGAWKKLDETKLAKDCQHPQPPGLALSLLPFQRESLSWMVQQERETPHKGGMLADEMGMGKTIQVIALLLTEPSHQPTLVIAPTVAILQWYKEITTHAAGLRPVLFHGTKRPTSMEELESYDVVLTSYSLVEGYFRREKYGARKKGEMVKTPSLLHAVQWHRVVLDEAHCIKDRSCNTARAAFALQSTYRWALSGTPLQNRVGELYSLVRFLQLDPFCYYFCRSCSCKKLTWDFKGYSACKDCGHSPMQHLCWWNNQVLKPIQNQGPNTTAGKAAMVKLGQLLQGIMIRRTKLERSADLGLPPRCVVIREDVFSDEESDLYHSLFSNSTTQFNTYVAENTVLNHYANIFELITRLRLAANHPSLVTTKMAKKYNLETQSHTSTTLVCAVCQDVPEDPIVSKCRHVFCRADAEQYIQSSIEARPKCPLCFAELTIDLTQPTLATSETNEGNVQELLDITTGNEAATTKAMSRINQATLYKSSIVNQLDLNRWQSSTKIEALVEELTNLRNENATIKSIVFSQFVSFLDMVQWRLTRAGFGCCRLDGRMGVHQRNAVIQAFTTQPEYTVFLVSLKAGGIALNLTEASHVFICDPWWNPAVEDQAMDRIHRLGQFRPIKITRLVIKDSIEARIIQLQEKKRAVFQSTIGQDATAMAKLSQEDLQFLFVS
ncbi:DNA repair protein rad16 [Dispira parvispora]|uniref:DNA repair protein rad16 n=1 Tax=Dispira parvispora TaxID=1520584 RepID=A0A9W8AVP2_9FUNG|nr:DNA repair protein rad16 [Dispira parvispora]